MKITECKHMPEKIAKPQADQCQEGDIEMHEFGLRVCVTCGHVGCCDDDPGQHARNHAKETNHQVMASYPANDDSFIWCYEDNDYVERKS